MNARLSRHFAAPGRFARPALALLAAIAFIPPALAAGPDGPTPDAKAGEKSVRADSSPISPGFWTWASEQLAPGQVAEECRKNFALQFDDGNYFGVTFDTAGRAVINEVGHCGYDARAGIERCDLSTNYDGVIRRGRTESTFYPETELRMRVRETEVGAAGDGPVNEYDIIPVRCPDEVIWEALNELGAPQGE